MKLPRRLASAAAGDRVSIPGCTGAIVSQELPEMRRRLATAKSISSHNSHLPASVIVERQKKKKKKTAFNFNMK